MKSKFAIAAAISISLFASCKKDAAVNNEPSVSENQIVYEMAREENFGGRMNNLFVFTQGQATVSEIKFDAKGDDKLEYRSKTVRTVNLFDPLTTIGALAVPYGTYQKIKAKIKFKSTPTTPALELRGNYTASGGVVTPLIIRVTDPFEAKFDIKEPVVINQNTNFSLLSTLVLSDISGRVTENMMNNADRDATGTVVISSDKNKNIYNKIWDALENMLRVKVKKK